MPITPFHLIAITPVKALAPKHFSWSVFVFTNIVIDLEPISLYLITLNPQHLFFHTIIGATLIAFICASFGKKCCEIAIDIWNEEIRGKPEAKWFTSNRKINRTSAWSGALIGAWSHLLLDSFMHDDIKPLSPFTDANVLFGTISIGWLHTMCLIVGVLGALALLIRRA
jgi:membrane-bound metal-dependent hydrolase YbcI (DUF457 family)